MEVRDWIWAAIVVIGVLTTWVVMRHAHIVAMIKERKKHERCYQKLEWYESQSLLAQPFHGRVEEDG